MLRNSETVRPIFSKIVSKVAQDLKEKSHQSAVRGEKIWRNYREKCGGGGPFRPPPSLFRVKTSDIRYNVSSAEEILNY